MPLEHSASKQAFKNNMKTLYGDIGKSPHVKNAKQAQAIAFETQRRAASGKASGGGVVPVDRDIGGGVDPVQAVIQALSSGSSSNGVAPQANNSAPSSATSASATGVLPTAGLQSSPTAISNNLMPKTATPVASPPAATGTPAASPPAVSSGSSPVMNNLQPVTSPILGSSSPISNLQSQPSPAPASPAGSWSSGILGMPNTSPNPIFSAISQPLIAPVAQGASSPIANSGVAAGDVAGAIYRAEGGFSMAKGPHLTNSWESRAAARQMRMGPIISAVPGRTDLHSSKVPSGSYVLPSQTVAGLGQGNSIAGLKAAHSFFGPGGPYGTPAVKMSHGTGAPKPPKLATFKNSGGYLSEGGAKGSNDGYPAVPVNLAGGEYIIHPDQVKSIGKGSLENGHRILDSFVMQHRKQDLKTIKNLPPPAKD